MKGLVPPKISELVHYYEQNRGPFVAIVTRIPHDDMPNIVDLQVFQGHLRMGDTPVDPQPINVQPEGVTRWEREPYEVSKP